MRISGPVLPVARMLNELALKPDAMFTREESKAAPAAGAAPPPSVPTGQTAQPVPSVQMLVALAAVDPDRERRRRMAEPAEEALDLLEDLHAELLSGAPPDRLTELAEWVKHAPVPDDPKLAELMSEIDLRVRVELAKFDIEI